MSNPESVNRVSYEDMLGHLQQVCKFHEDQISNHMKQLRYYRGAMEAVRGAIADRSELEELKMEKSEWVDRVKGVLVDQWMGPRTVPMISVEDFDSKFGVWKYTDGQTIKVD